MNTNTWKFFQKTKQQNCPNLLEHVESRTLRSKIYSLIGFHQTIEIKAKISELKRVDYDEIKTKNSTEIEAIAYQVFTGGE